MSYHGIIQLIMTNRYKKLEKEYDLKELYLLRKSHFYYFLFGCLSVIIFIPIDILLKLIIKKSND